MQTSHRAAVTVLRATKAKVAQGLSKLGDQLRAEQQEAEAALDELKAGAD